MDHYSTPYYDILCLLTPQTNMEFSWRSFSQHVLEELFRLSDFTALDTHVLKGTSGPNVIATVGCDLLTHHWYEYHIIQLLNYHICICCFDFA